MFISKVCKKDRIKDKSYFYFRLMRSYRIGNKTRQEFILSLGTLAELPSQKHKMLADRIEQILNNEIDFFNTDVQVEELARKFSIQIIESKKTFVNKSIQKNTIEELGQKPEFHTVDINSVISENAREIGAEWLSKQAVEQLGLNGIIEQKTNSGKLVSASLISIISRIVHPAGELETERWLNENTALNRLFNLDADQVSRYELGKAAEFLYDNKEFIEKEIHTKIKNLFSLQSKIVIYDLTNIFFEGRKQNSKYCKFGRSKEKRSDCRLICVALLVDIHGFIMYSHFYSGNQSEPQTLADVVADIKRKTPVANQYPVIVMDAGISTEENLKELRAGKQDYVCVSRSKLNNYELSDENPVIVEDNRNNKILLQKVIQQTKDDNFIFVKSEQKAAKEHSMDERFTEKFEKELEEFNRNLQKKGARRKFAEIYQRMGRMKERNHYISGQYDISFTQDEKLGIVTSIQWKRKPVKNQYDGSYFLRYSNKDMTANEIWNIYNTIREVEQTFRTLKTDLQIRPIHHQNDKNILSHIFVGILAYQIVNSIRFQLKTTGVTLSWTKIVEKMNTYKSVTTEMITKDGKKIILKYCLRPSPWVADIFEKLNYKIPAFTKQKFVVT